jgi:L-rhamnose mutarotase
MYMVDGGVGVCETTFDANDRHTNMITSFGFMVCGWSVPKIQKIPGLSGCHRIGVEDFCFYLQTMGTRVAFKMKLKPGQADEYRQRHENIWPELKELLHDAGIRNYTIFLDVETDTLFAVQEVTGTEGSQFLGSHAIVRKWWSYMADIMETNPDLSPVSVPLKEVFHLD